MSQLSDRVKDLKQRENELQKELHQLLSEAGTHMLKSPAEVEGADLAALRTQAKELKEQIQSVRNERDTIAATRDRIAETKAAGNELRSHIKELTDNLDPIYEEIGGLAFDVYRGNPLVDQEYADIFGPLVEVHSELGGIDAAIAEQTALIEQKPFLEKMVIRGRIALLRNRKTTREGSFRRLVRATGREIMATNFVDEIGDPGLLRATEPYRERLRSVREAESRLGELESERGKLSAELETLSANKRPQRRIDELESDLETLETAIASVFSEIAAAVRAAGAEVPAKAQKLLESADALSERIRRAADLRDRAQAGVEAERLERVLLNVNRDIDTAEQRLAEVRRNLADLESTRKETESSLAENRERQGDIEELLAGDLIDSL